MGASLVVQRLKRLPAMRETWVRSLGWEAPLEKEIATHSSILAWRIPWMEEPGGLQSTGSQRVGHDWATSLHFTLLLILLTPHESCIKWAHFQVKGDHKFLGDQNMPFWNASLWHKGYLELETIEKQQTPQVSALLTICTKSGLEIYFIGES